MNRKILIGSLVVLLLSIIIAVVVVVVVLRKDNSSYEDYSEIDYDEIYKNNADLVLEDKFDASINYTGIEKVDAAIDNICREYGVEFTELVSDVKDSITNTHLYIILCSDGREYYVSILSDGSVTVDGPDEY